jgi:tetratricopeptide (TPR) repeat protein
MSKKVFWISTIAVLLSFAGGFLLANALNRAEMDDLRGEIGRLKKSPQSSVESVSNESLSDEEIRQKIEEADKNAENIEYQKSLAMALYRYSNMKQETKWLPDIAKMLNRAFEKNPKDYNTILSLGNLYFEISQITVGTENAEEKNEASKNIETARSFYQKALEINPKDADVRTDLALTYLFENPPQNEKAVVEFQKALQINPKHERALENIIRAFLNSQNNKEAGEFLGKLKEASPNNESIADLEKRLAQDKNHK